MLRCDKCNKTYQTGVYCPSCGEKLQKVEGSAMVGTGSKKSPFLAGFLSLIVPGIGQIYNGQTAKGVVCILVHLFLIPTYFFIQGWIDILFWGAVVVDAYKQCKLLNEQERIGHWTFFSQTKK